MLTIYPDSFSQSGQESFVLSMLDGLRGGFFIEIGAFDSKELSNTYLLESVFKWKGIAFEIDKKRSREYNRNRVNLCVRGDATIVDYKKCFTDFGAPSVIDYLQVDIEPAKQSLTALKRIPFDSYSFKVITFEHDLYADKENIDIQTQALEFLESFGYQRVALNVKNNGLPYEDWYVHPAFVTKKVKLLSDVEWSAHFSTSL